MHWLELGIDSIANRAVEQASIEAYNRGMSQRTAKREGFVERNSRVLRNASFAGAVILEGLAIAAAPFTAPLAVAAGYAAVSGLGFEIIRNSAGRHRAK